MDTLLQVAGLGLIAVLLGLVLKKGNGVLALLLTLASNLLTDILYGVVDPRVRIS